MRLARLWINSDTLYRNYTKSDGLFDGSQISNLIKMQIYDRTDMVMLNEKNSRVRCKACNKSVTTSSYPFLSLFN